MKLARSIVGMALILLAISVLTNTASQQSKVTQMQKKPPGATQVYVPPFRISTERPISFEEFPSTPAGHPLIATVNEQYEEALGITFNDVAVYVYPEGFAHGTKAISKCVGEFDCDPFLLKFSRKPQRRVKVWFGYRDAVPRPDQVVLKIFNLAGAPIGEKSAELAINDRPLPVSKELEITSENGDIGSATVSFRNTNSVAGLVLDDIDFDDLLPQPDLTIESVQAQLGLDRQLMVTAGIRNIGKGSSIPTTLELSEPKFWDEPPGIAVKALNPGELVSVNFVTSLPADQPRSALDYTAVVDPKETIRDSDTRNNSKSDRFVVARGKPDLTVRIVDAGVDSNDHAFVITEITNIGNAASTPTVVEVESSGQTIGTATVAPVQPQGSILVNVSIPQKPSAGQHNFQAVVNRDNSLDEADLTNNSVTGLLAIPGISWPPLDVLIPILICVFIGGLFLTYTLVKRKPGRPRITAPTPPSSQGPSQPSPTVPTFVARPTLDPGRQEISLASPNIPTVALNLRAQSGASSTQIFDGITPLDRGEP